MVISRRLGCQWLPRPAQSGQTVVVPEVQQTLQGSLMWPPRKSLSTAKYLRTPHLEKMVELSDRYGVPAPRVPDAALFRETLRSAADDVFTGRITPEQALAAATRKLQAEVDRSHFRPEAV